MFHSVFMYIINHIPIGIFLGNRKLASERKRAKLNREKLKLDAEKSKIITLQAKLR